MLTSFLRRLLRQLLPAPDRVPDDPRVVAARAFAAAIQPTAREAHALLDVWQFDNPEPITVFLVRRAKLRRHRLLPEPEWAVLLEDDEILSQEKVAHITEVLVKLAERSGVRTRPEEVEQ